MRMSMFGHPKLSVFSAHLHVPKHRVCLNTIACTSMFAIINVMFVERPFTHRAHSRNTLIKFTLVIRPSVQFVILSRLNSTFIIMSDVYIKLMDFDLIDKVINLNCRITSKNNYN